MITDKQSVAYPRSGKVLVSKRKKITDPCDNVDESYRHDVEQKEPDTKEGILSDSSIF